MKEHLTHEFLKKKFKNSFDLTNYAIGLSHTDIKDGEVKSLHEIVEDLSDLPDIEFSKNEKQIDE